MMFCDMSDISDILWQFPSLSPIDVKHKNAIIFIKCDFLRHFVMIYLPSPSCHPLFACRRVILHTCCAWCFFERNAFLEKSYKLSTPKSRDITIVSLRYCPLLRDTLSASAAHMSLLGLYQPASKYHTKGCSRSSGHSPGARTLVFFFLAFEPCLGVDFRASIAQTPFCVILWHSPTLGLKVYVVVEVLIHLRGASMKHWPFRDVLDEVIKPLREALASCTWLSYHSNQMFTDCLNMFTDRLKIPGIFWDEMPTFRAARRQQKTKLWGGGHWGQRGAPSKNAVVGNTTIIKYWNGNFYCRGILLSLRRLLDFKFLWLLDR